MNSNFPRMITLLRREHGLSQKKAAEELNISQALLSHYEKGIRECGLDFLVRISEYYGVSCDYVLGRTPGRTGAQLVIDDEKTDDSSKNSRHNVNRKLVFDSLNIIYDLLQKSKSQALTAEISSYMFLSVYQIFRTLYSSNPKNPEGLFTVPSQLYSALSDASMRLSLINALACASGTKLENVEPLENRDALQISPANIQNSYPQLATSLFHLIQLCESKIRLESEQDKD